MTKLTISLGEEELKILKKRAKKNLLTLREQAEDIIRRSCVYSKSATAQSQIKCDDSLVGIFSRARRGRKSRKKKKVKKKK